MKKFHPYKAGFIVMYVLCVLCIGDAVYGLYRQMKGIADEFTQSFSMFTYLIAILSVLYLRIYAVTRVEIDDKTFHFVNPVYIRPAAGEKRASFIYRQGDLDIKIVNKRFPLMELERYGFIEDLGYSRLDKSGTGPDNKLFPVREIALVMKDGRRFHMNGGNYSINQLKGIVAQIEKVTGLKPEGYLGDLDNMPKPEKKKKSKNK